LIVGQEPGPDFAAAVADEMQLLVAKFDDPTLRTIAQRKLEGCTNDEIAVELSLSVRTVIRKLHLIRQEWEAGKAN
jgi:DNA-directed RNA polymerase specialized sigma24 family protein